MKGFHLPIYTTPLPFARLKVLSSFLKRPCLTAVSLPPPAVTVGRCIDWEKVFALQDPAHQLDASCHTFIYHRSIDDKEAFDEKAFLNAQTS